MYCSAHQEPGESTVHLLPFMLPGVGRVEDDLRGLYKRVKKAMEGIHQLNHANNIKELERIATEWSVEPTTQSWFITMMLASPQSIKSCAGLYNYVSLHTLCHRLVQENKKVSFETSCWLLNLALSSNSTRVFLL